ncbi:hypothetical protein GCM10023219_07920 [Stakelama sediminis]|uniref:hypothetical protein n=1 Tax=Stakelama sediminis TaxID=463200 RepID=UPI003387240D
MNFRKYGIAAALAFVPLVAGCSKTGDISTAGGVGITAIRTSCPEVAVPAGTGDITLFNPATSQDASAIDVTATITDVRSTCNDSGANVLTNITFNVEARRSKADGARDVTFPYFITVVRGGSAVTAKRIGHATVHFAAGQLRAQVSAQGATSINRAAATIPQDIRDKITQKRKAGQADAAVDPLSEPDVQQAIQRATFEALVGFQLTEDQLKYNATR